MLLFDRKAQLITKDYTFRSWEGVIFSFKYSTTGDDGVPSAEIEITNLTKRLRNLINKGEVIFSIGYGDYLGDLIVGDISNLEITDKVKFDVVGNSDINLKNYTNWYNKGVRENTIVDDIANKLGLKVQGSELLSDYIQQNGYSTSNNGIKIIQDICRNRGLKVTFDGRLIKIFDKNGVKTNVVLDIYSGLTNVTKYTGTDEKYDYIVHSIPIPVIKQGDIIEVKHDDFTGAGVVEDFEINGSTNWSAKYFIKVRKGEE